MQTQINSLESIMTSISTLGISLAQNGQIPTLSSYSAVPSLQNVATQHSKAIDGSSGCAVSVTNAIYREIEWCSTNLKSMTESIKHQETTIAHNFSPTKLSLKPEVNTQFFHNFSTRPEFQVGALSFQAASLMNETSLEPQNLLRLFESSRDDYISEAIKYWEDASRTMANISESVLFAAERLTEEHEGDAFLAASDQLRGLSTRILLVSESSEIMAGSLAPLPHIRQGATTKLHQIIGESHQIRDHSSREIFARAEVDRYLTSQYLIQLQNVVPALESLTLPHHRSSGGILGASTAPENETLSSGERDSRNSPISTHTASAISVLNSVSSPMHQPTSQTQPTVSNGPVTPNVLGTLQGTTLTHSDSSVLRRTATQPSARANTGKTQPNSLHPGSSRRAFSGASAGGIAGSTTVHPKMQAGSGIPSGVANTMMNAPAPARLSEGSKPFSRPLGTPQLASGPGGHPNQGSPASESYRSTAGSSIRVGTTTTPFSSLDNTNKRSVSPITKVSKSRPPKLTNANQQRLFGTPEPTVPGVIGADLRE